MKKNLEDQSVRTYENMVESLPEKYQERKNTTVEYAREVCGFPSVEKYEDGIESSDEAQAFIRQLQNTVSITNQYLETGLQADDLAPAYSGAKKFAKYASSVDSYKKWRSRGCEVVQSPTNKTMEKFYRSTAVLTFEVILIQTAASYKISSKATRIFNRQAGVARVRKYCGDECYSAALSLPHWGVRFSSEGFADYVLDVSNSNNLDLEKEKIEEVTSDIREKLPERKVQKTVIRAAGNAKNSTGSLIAWFLSLFV